MLTTRSITLLKWVGLLVTGYSIYAFGISISKDPMTLQEAIKNGLVNAEFSSKDKMSYRSVFADISNHTGRSLSLIIPAGTMYEPDEDDEQTLLQLEDQLVTINGKEEKTFEIKTYCTEASDRCPSGTFTLNTNNDEQFVKLITYISTKPTDKEDLQEAVWAISDRHPVSNISNTDDKSKELRQFTAQLTNQEDNWYQSPQQYRVDERGNINRETVHISGELAFSPDRTMTVHEEIQDSTGKMIIRSDRHFQLRAGNVTYTFNIRVKGWTKGTYYVKVLNAENEVLVTKEFQV